MTKQVLGQWECVFIGVVTNPIHTHCELVSNGLAYPVLAWSVKLTFTIFATSLYTCIPMSIPDVERMFPKSPFCIQCYTVLNSNRDSLKKKLNSTDYVLA